MVSWLVCFLNRCAISCGLYVLTEKQNSLLNYCFCLVWVYTCALCAREAVVGRFEASFGYMVLKI